MAPTWWGFCLAYIVSGRWQRCSLQAFRAPGVAIVDGLNVQTHLQARRACREARLAVESAREFFAALSTEFQDVVLQSHGNHVPQAVRDGATVLFWLPEILSDRRLIHQTFETGVEEDAFWLFQDLLHICALHVGFASCLQLCINDFPDPCDCWLFIGAVSIPCFNNLACIITRQDLAVLEHVDEVGGILP